MIYIYIALSLLVLLFLTAIFMKMALHINITKTMDSKMKSELTIKIFGKKINLLKRNKKDKPSKKGKADDKEKQTEPLGKRIKTLFENIERGRYTYLLSKRYVRKNITLESLDFSMTFGLDDAAHTGIATGALWGSVYNIYAFLDKLFIVKAHKFNITPVFDGEAFELDFDTNIKFSISNLISIAFAVIINYMKSGKK